jgi:hypothetical protein
MKKNALNTNNKHYFKMSNERQFSKTIVLCSLLDDGRVSDEQRYKRRTKLVLERELKRQQLAVEIECGKQVADDGLAAQNQLTLQVDYILRCYLWNYRKQRTGKGNRKAFTIGLITKFVILLDYIYNY